MLARGGDSIVNIGSISGSIDNRGVSSVVARAMAGVTSRCRWNVVHPRAASSTIRPAKVEAEIVFIPGHRLPGPGVTITDARRAIAGAAAAMKIVDSRIADWRIKLADTVADLASNEAMVVTSRLVALDNLIHVLSE